jgi:23S rRNA (adenine2503-C2)-methyltransferase
VCVCVCVCVNMIRIDEYIMRIKIIYIYIGCTFCATGRMGLMKRLSSDEILIQLYYANKICRVLNDMYHNDNYDHNSNGNFEGTISENNNKKDNSYFLPEIDNIVFMGMGDSGDNPDAVIKACSIMADRQCFAIPQNKITISTVGPNPEIFSTLSQADAVLAWSVHAVNDTLRKKLVPTTKYSMDELREGLINALIGRSKRMRAVMIEITLIEDVNDGIDEAKEMVDFCIELKDRVPGMKLVVNLIPFNDISHVSYRRSPKENVAAYQQVLVENGVMAYVRTTRGDDENAACGQLATKKLKQENLSS